MVHGKVINLEVHDTGGCDLVEHAEWIQKWWAANSYRILVYDVTSRQSFDRLKELVEKHHPSSAAFIYAALPLGGEGVIPRKEGFLFANNHGLPFMQEGDKVYDPFILIANMILAFIPGQAT